MLADLRVDVAAFADGPDDLRVTLSAMDVRVLRCPEDARRPPSDPIIARTLHRNPVRSAVPRTARRIADVHWRNRPFERRP